MDEKFLKKSDINIEKLKQEVLPKITTFVKDQIETGKLWIWGEHGHLGYKDEKFIGHYIFPNKEGVEVTVWLKGTIAGDKNSTFDVFIPLDKATRMKLLEKMRQDLEEAEKDDFEQLQELKDSITEMESGLDLMP